MLRVVNCEMTNLLLILLLVVGCSTKEKGHHLYQLYNYLDSPIVKKTDLEIDVLYPGEAIPENCDILGDIFVAPYNESPDGTLDCSYDSVLNRAAEKTKELGGNAFKITNLKTPSVDNPCYRISALALILND